MDRDIEFDVLNAHCTEYHRWVSDIELKVWPRPSSLRIWLRPYFSIQLRNRLIREQNLRRSCSFVSISIPHSQAVSIKAWSKRSVGYTRRMLRQYPFNLAPRTNSSLGWNLTFGLQEGWWLQQGYALPTSSTEFMWSREKWCRHDQKDFLDLPFSC